MEAIILAGGFGTRLRHIVSNVPKPMAPVAGRPFLEYILSDLEENGVDHVVLAVCHMKDSIIGHFGGRFHDMKLDYSEEQSPLKTGGAIKKAMTLCHEDRILVVNGDTYYKVPLQQMHAFASGTGKLATIAVKEMEQFTRYGKVDLDKDGLITAFHEKAFCPKGYINGGVYDIARETLQGYPEVFSMEEDCFPNLLKIREVAGFVCDTYFIDIGVPEDYARAQNDFRG